MKKQICILGSTGSIGTQALDVIEQHADLYEVYCLTANNRIEELARQAHRFKPAAIVVATLAVLHVALVVAQLIAILVVDVEVAGDVVGIEHRVGAELNILASLVVHLSSLIGEYGKGIDVVAVLSA